MDRESALAVVEHYLYTADRDVAHEIHHEDAVLEFPQSGERFDASRTRSRSASVARAVISVRRE